MKKKNKKVDHAKACRKLYEDIGTSAIYDYAVKHKLTDYRYCKSCDANTPTHNDCCLICGSDCSIEIIEGESRVSMAGIRLHGIDKKPLEFKVRINTESYFPRLDLLVNGKTAAILQYDQIKNQIRIHTYEEGGEEPVSSVYKQFKKKNGKT